MKKRIETRQDTVKRTVFSWDIEEAAALLLNSFAALPRGAKIHFEYEPAVGGNDYEEAHLLLIVEGVERGRTDIQNVVTTGKVQSV